MYSIFKKIVLNLCRFIKHYVLNSGSIFLKSNFAAHLYRKLPTCNPPIEKYNIQRKFNSSCTYNSITQTKPVKFTHTSFANTLNIKYECITHNMWPLHNHIQTSEDIMYFDSM